MKADNRRYSIGDYVIVSRKMRRYKLGVAVKWEPGFTYRSPQLGQVVGLCTRYDGKVMYSNVNNGWEYDPPYFAPEKAHQFWLVRFGLTNKPVCVRAEDMRLAAVDEIADLPYSYPPSSMSERDKENLRVDSRNWPRDEKGRWIAGPAI